MIQLHGSAIATDGPLDLLLQPAGGTKLSDNSAFTMNMVSLIVMSNMLYDYSVLLMLAHASFYSQISQRQFSTIELICILRRKYTKSLLFFIFYVLIL